MQQVTFDITTGKITADGILIGIAYSGGDAGARLDAVNNPAFQSAHNVGPIPVGTYSAQQVNQPSKGPLVWMLTPDPGNEMYGRSGFMVHWDTSAAAFLASDGCIVPLTHSTFYKLQAEFSLTVLASGVAS